MTDSGQVVEGEQQGRPTPPGAPGAPAPTGPQPFSAAPEEAGDDEELLMPGAPGAWADAVVAPPSAPPAGTATPPATTTSANTTPANGTPAGAPSSAAPAAAPPGAPDATPAGTPPNGTPADTAAAPAAPAEATPGPAAAGGRQPSTARHAAPPPAAPTPAQPVPGTPAAGTSAPPEQVNGTPPADAAPAQQAPAAAPAAGNAPDRPAAQPAPAAPSSDAAAASESQPAAKAAPAAPSAPVATTPARADAWQPPAQPGTAEPSTAEPSTTGPTTADPTGTEPATTGSAPEPAEAAPRAAPAAAGATPAEPSGGTDQAQAAAASPPPAAGGLSPADREAVHRLMSRRRDVPHRFRPDPVPHDVLLRVLKAAHTAPSVGLTQPWDFLIIRSAETRQKVQEIASRQREAYAATLPRARARQLRELNVEAIGDAPVNIVVTADPTRGGRQSLGPVSEPQLAPYSAALAVENLWLAAHAEGLGVGWVSFFDEQELAKVLDLPEHLELVAYLCVGYAETFPDGPQPDADRTATPRRPLSWVVHEESYGRRALPGAEPHDLLGEALAEIRPLDARALGEAWERQKRMTKPAGSLGALEAVAAQLCGLARTCPPPVPEPAAVAVFAGDHGVHAQGVTAWPQEVTGQMVTNFLTGGAVCNAFAGQVGAEVCVVDVGVRGELPTAPGLMPRRIRSGTADITTEPAMEREEALRAVEVGIETARDLVAAGHRVLLTGEMGIANTTVAAALVAVFTGADPAEVTGRGTGIDDETHARKVDVVRRALARHEPDPTDPIAVLASVGGLEHAALTGLILGGAALRVPVILDGVSAGAAALAARAFQPEAVAACIAGHRSVEPGHHAALSTLGLRPLVDLDLRLGEGTGALLALPVVQSAARALSEVATFDAAGVSERG